jgi:hypothetical protein
LLVCDTHQAPAEPVAAALALQRLTGPSLLGQAIGIPSHATACCCQKPWTHKERWLLQEVEHFQLPCASEAVNSRTAAKKAAGQLLLQNSSGQLHMLPPPAAAPSAACWLCLLLLMGVECTFLLGSCECKLLGYGLWLQLARVPCHLILLLLSGNRVMHALFEHGSSGV